MSLSFVTAVQTDIEILFAEFGELGSDQSSSRNLEDDATELIAVALEQVSRQINVPELDAFAEKASELDLAMVGRAFEILAAVQGTPSYGFAGSGQNPITWNDELQSMRDRLNSFGEIEREHGPLEASLRLSILLDGGFFRLLLCEVPTDTLEALEELVEESLRPINNDDLVRFWAGVLREFSEDRVLAPYSRKSNALPEGFLELSSSSDLRRRLAEYVVRVKPALARERFAEKEGATIPAEAVGLASVLARKTNVSFSGLERRVLSLLVSLYESWGRTYDAEFRRSLGLSEGAWVTRAGQFAPKRRQHSFGIMGRPPVNCKKALRTAKRLLIYADSQAREVTPLEQALWMYKLGLEVSFQPKHLNAGLFDETRDLQEIYLQRHACRYLTDRGIAAFGASFGRSEIDLLAQHDAELIVIEAKIFKIDSDWRKINKHLAQLQRYMDQQRVTPRGILLIYNRSSVALESSVRWIRGRYWVLVVNLCAEPPSGTKRSVLIEEGDEQLLALTPNF